MRILLSLVLAAATAVHPASDRRLGETLQPVLDAGAPAAMALVRHDNRVRQAAVGEADTATGRRADPGDHFRAGSITKTFVAVVVLQLVAEHRIGLDDRLGRWLPGVLPYADTITVRQLLNHTSGVPEYLGSVVQAYADDPGSWLRHWDPAERVAFVAQTPPEFPAGSQGRYSNTDYVLLGMIVERTTGQSLSHNVSRRITQPLHLRDTTLPGDALWPPEPAMHGYVPVPDAPPVDTTEWNPSAAGAAGALVSTLADLARFYRALLRGELLPPPLLRTMLTTVDVDGIAYGLGIFRIDTPCGPAYGHNGGVFGYFSDVFTTRDGSRQVALAENLYDLGAWQAQENLIGTLLCR